MDFFTLIVAVYAGLFGAVVAGWLHHRFVGGGGYNRGYSNGHADGSVVACGLHDAIKEARASIAAHEAECDRQLMYIKELRELQPAPQLQKLVDELNEELELRNNNVSQLTRTLARTRYELHQYYCAVTAACKALHKPTPPTSPWTAPSGSPPKALPAIRASCNTPNVGGTVAPLPGALLPGAGLYACTACGLTYPQSIYVINADCHSPCCGAMYRMPTHTEVEGATTLRWQAYEADPPTTKPLTSATVDIAGAVRTAFEEVCEEEDARPGYDLRDVPPGVDY